MPITYLITGGAGFVGSHIADSLVARGDHVVAFDDLSTGRVENLSAANASSNLSFVQGSVLDDEAVDQQVRSCDFVLHLAAAVGVKLIVEHPLQSLTTNIRGAETVLGAAHRHDKPVLVVSTSEIYGKNADVPLAETADRVLGSPAVSRWAYSTSKAVDEILAYAYHREHHLSTFVVRLFNTVGPRQSPAYGMVIPRLVRQALTGSPMTVFGDGSQTRCFCHVADAVDAFLGIIASDAAVGEVFNVGSPEEISILELAERIRKLANSSSEITLIPYGEAYESGFEDMLRRVPDTTKLNQLTGWRAERTLDTILEETISEARSELDRA